MIRACAVRSHLFACAAFVRRVLRSSRLSTMPPGKRHYMYVQLRSSTRSFGACMRAAITSHITCAGRTRDGAERTACMRTERVASVARALAADRNPVHELCRAVSVHVHIAHALVRVCRQSFEQMFELCTFPSTKMRNSERGPGRDMEITRDASAL